jgi:hypothetical protein
VATCDGSKPRFQGGPCPDQVDQDRLVSVQANNDPVDVEIVPFEALDRSSSIWIVSALGS